MPSKSPSVWEYISSMFRAKKKERTVQSSLRSISVTAPITGKAKKNRRKSVSFSEKIKKFSYDESDIVVASRDKDTSGNRSNRSFSVSDANNATMIQLQRRNSKILPQYDANEFANHYK